MNKKQKKELKKNIENEEYIDENNEMIFKKLVFNPLFRGGAMMILLIFSLINSARIKRLAALTSHAIFSNEYILGAGTYFTILGVTIGICFLISLFSIIVKSNMDLSSIVVLRKAYQVYSIYDMVIFILSTFVCLFFIIMILITPCNISGSSMEDTYHEGDRVLLWNIGYQPKDGDVIVFDSKKYTSIHISEEDLSKKDESRFFIKRVVAKENDIITFKTKNLIEGSLYVNDVEVDTIRIAQYRIILSSIDLSYQENFTVPKDKVLVMGDNRDISFDSRAFGFIDESEIIGKVLLRFYPFNKIGNPKPNIK